MNLDKDISSWAQVRPEAVATMSQNAQTNVLTMALHDIGQLGAEVERLAHIIKINYSGYRRTIVASVPEL